MTTPNLHLTVAQFAGEAAARSAQEALVAASKDEALGAARLAFEDSATVSREADGKLRIHETGEMGAGKGAVIGGAIGAAIGLLAGPAGVVAGGALGAWFGGLAAGSVDGGIPDMDLAAIGAMLEPGHAAVVVTSDESQLAAVSAFLREQGGEVLTPLPSVGEEITDH